MKKQLLLLVMLLLPLVASADAVQINGIWYDLYLEKKQALVICNPDKKTKYSGSVDIPSYIYHHGSYRVTSIGSLAFRGCSGLTSVTIPNSVASIGEGAFTGCSNLTSVTLNSNAIVSEAYTSSSEYIKTIFGEQVTEYVIGDDVTSIGNYAFYNCSGLTSVTIPNTVTSIGDNAFSNCTGLTTVTIPNSVTSIGYEAFYNCFGLTSVTIGNSVTSIGDYAFWNCSNLSSMVVKSGNTNYDSRNDCNAIIETASNTLIAGCKNTIIPNSVTSIGEAAFNCCSGLTSIDIPNSVTSIDRGAFFFCKGLTSITIPNSVTSIGALAFVQCSGLTSIIVESGNTTYDSRNNCNAIIETASNTLMYGCMNTIIPNSVTSIGSSAFSHCSGLTSVTIPNSVTSIGNSAFAYCSGLTTIDIPNSVTSINMSTFSGCSGLTSVTIPNSVTSIGNSAFWNCSGLTSVIIGNSVTSIGDYAFQYCSGLTSVCALNPTPIRITKDVFSNRENATLYVPKGSEDAYKAASYWKEFKDIVEMTAPTNIVFVDANVKAICVAHWDTNGDGELCTHEAAAVTTISNYFKYNTSITSFDEFAYFTGVTSIGESAFNYCDGLTSVTIPNSVTSIGDKAFEGCKGLTSITIPNNVTSIGEAVFCYCYGLTSVTIPNSVTSIGAWAFGGCRRLSSVVIPNSVTSIGESAFSGCSGLTTIDIPNSVTSIGNSAFWNCSGLTSVIIGNSVTSIGDYAFQYCSGLTSITIGNSVTSIGDYAFQYCSGLKKIIVKDIAAWCNISFNSNPLLYAHHLYCDENTEITNLVIPNGVTSIGAWAFESCSGLTSVTIPNSVTSIGVAAFYECSGLKKVIVKDIAAWCGINFGSGDNPLYYAHHLYSDENTEITNLVIPNSVTSIGDWAFESCFGLTSVTIPNSVTNIGQMAFYDCTGLTSVTALNTTPVAISQNVFSNRKNATLYVPNGSKSAYQAADYWKEFKEIVEIETTGIDQISFQENGEQGIDQEGAVWYTIDGKQVDKPKKGINIIRMSDGTTKKVVVK